MTVNKCIYELKQKVSLFAEKRHNNETAEENKTFFINSNVFISMIRIFNTAKTFQYNDERYIIILLYMTINKYFCLSVMNTADL